MKIEIKVKTIYRFLKVKHLNLYTKGNKKIKRTWKCVLCDQLPFIYRLKLYALLFINGENEAILYRQWFIV